MKGQDVPLCTVCGFVVRHAYNMNTNQTIVDDAPISELEAALADLEGQGLTIRLHSIQDNTWHIADGGLYSGYAVSGNELVELSRSGKLNMTGIKELG